MSKQYLDDETGGTVEVAPEDVHPLGLVIGEFVETGDGEFVRAAAVSRVLEMAPYRDASKPRTYRTNVVTGEGGETGSCWSVYPAHTILAALNMALENGRRRTVERVDC